jgi:two-component system sensor histidine kinase/response regulator
MQFLVVEDDPVMQILTPRMLHTLGYAARLATNGSDAIGACLSEPPDVVLMDVQMPLMDGLEATRELRRLQHAGDLPPFPIIVLSAYHAPAERAACFDAGADGFVTKPLMLAKLATEIHRVMTRSRRSMGILVGGREAM